MEGSNENVSAHSVLRLVIPTKMAGTLIGKGGSNVRTISEETGAKLKILELPQGSFERVLMVSALEEENSELSAAREAMTRIHDQLIASEEALGTTTFTTKLLMPNGQTGTLIGKGGEMIRSMQEESGATIRITEVHEAPPCALPEDRMVELSGSGDSVKLAMQFVLDRLRKFGVDRSVLPHFDHQKGSMGGSMGGMMQGPQPGMYMDHNQPMYQAMPPYGGGGMGPQQVMYAGGQGGQPVMMQPAPRQMVMMAPGGGGGGAWGHQGGPAQGGA
eukprot:CAMPEP_0196584952 /NCGR_PEP_ID=MMETSP1081-20130531/49117_1 /TAXON_ID=36882 /ORGANISM="Pyramimonas amylifera, Strain CCMP720" /LENGTH=273 /DNA_ID=CAMNT_0041906345 /DNA_START=129 /DNA_END=946 /DNA_ORIENTATION=-